jgi:hypothetical protein
MEMASEHSNDDCKEIFAKLSAFLDMELPPDACHEIERHMAGCPPCVEFVESLRKTVQLCHGYEPAEMPRPLGENARRELRDAWQRMLAARKKAH